MYNRITIKGDGDVATIYKEIQKERYVHMLHKYNTHIHIIVIVTILSSFVINVLLSFLFDLLFRREALRQHRNNFLIILSLGYIKRCHVGIEESITVRLDCAIAAKVD